jgi:hypothetical protein
MDMDQAAVFLAGSILTMLGFIVVVIGIVAINNILHKYWKPVAWIKYDLPPRFITRAELATIQSHEEESKK